MPATTFSDMPTLASSSSHTRSPPFHRRRKSWARKIERCCCTTFAYFPLVFVYGLTSWAVYVEVHISFLGIYGWLAYVKAVTGIALYALANVSYSIAVFTSAGSPLDRTRDGGGNLGRRKGGGYEGLPMHEDAAELGDVQIPGLPHDWMKNSVTAKSTGRPRYCKKCRSVKPDRTHHCSTCGRCVLKMDHHCPWLATCVGLKNYKPFLLFLAYVSLFCWVCFAVAASWVWAELSDDGSSDQGLLIINAILLSVLGGIIGLVLSAFSGWHFWLASTGQTTIESLEKTRYLSPLKKSLEAQPGAGRHYLGAENGTLPRPLSADENQPLSERLKEIHANALPGVLRPEEGDTSLHNSRNPSPVPSSGAAAGSSPAQASLHRSYASLEAQREHERYNAYLDEQDSEKMPNAFDMGWKQNLLHIFGDQPTYWFLPVCNTIGDGWMWDVSPKWLEARDRIGIERQQRVRHEAQWERPAGSDAPPRQPAWKWSPGAGFVDRHVPPPVTTYVTGSRRQSPNKPADGATLVPMQSLDRSKDEDELANAGVSVVDEDSRVSGGMGRQEGTASWNDVPDDYLSPRKGQRNRSRSRGRRKGD